MTILVPFAVAFLVTLLLGKPIISYLHKMKFGQKILEIGPKWHMNKQNTPTMGGVMFIIGTVAAMLAGNLAGASLGASSFVVLALALAYGAVGFVDDYAKIKKKQNAGLTAKQKLILQIIVACIFIALLRLVDAGLNITAAGVGVYVPFANSTFYLPWAVYLVFAAFVIVGTNNAVNLTDGIDGLATTVTMIVTFFFTLVAERQGNLPAMIFAAALTGALVAFRFFNAHPAKVFMGDTGSLFLGGAVAGLAFACDMPLILILVGFVYIVETLSDIIQVVYFKATHGKRFFKMAPIHHHFEMCGWSENKIVSTFSLVTIIMCILAYIGVMPRF